MYQIRLYENTGYNTVNVPYSKKYLTNAARKVYDSVEGENFDGSLEPLDIVQNRNLASIKVNATWDMVNQCDYCVLYKHTETTTEESIQKNGWCYIVTNCVMANTDTAILTLAQDFLTSVDGARRLATEDDDRLVITDGVVSRSSWALKQVMSTEEGTLTVLDVDLNDAMLTPSGSMKLLVDRTTYSGLGSGAGSTFVLSTIDLSSAHNFNAHKFTTPTIEGEDYVVVPTLNYVSNENSVKFSLIDFDGNLKEQDYPGVCAVKFADIYPNSYFRTALSNIRALGLESAIIDQYFVPSIYCTPTSADTLLTRIQGRSGILPQAAWSNNNVNVTIHEGTIGNILNYSPFETIGLVSATGSKMEVHPQDLRDPDNSNAPLTGVPEIAFIADARPDGKPFFTIKGIHGQPLGITTLLLSCIEGLTWQKVPLVWNMGASGNALNTVRYNASYSLGQDLTKMQMSNAGKMYDLYNTPLASRVLGEVSDANNVPNAQFASPPSMYDMRERNRTGLASFYGATQGSIGSDLYQRDMLNWNNNSSVWSKNNSLSIGDAAKDALSKVTGWGADLVNDIAHAPGINALLGYDIKAQSFANSQQESWAQFVHDNILDRLEYDLSNSYYAPSIAFPYGASIWDFLGNGVVRYKYKYYGTEEIPRLKKLIKAYGLQYKEYLAPKFFRDEALMDAGDDDHTKYLYVQTSSVTISGRARWINEGIAAQLSNGVRFWKGRPRHIQMISGE